MHLHVAAYIALKNKDRSFLPPSSWPDVMEDPIYTYNDSLLQQTLQHMISTEMDCIVKAKMEICFVEASEEAVASIILNEFLVTLDGFKNNFFLCIRISHWTEHIKIHIKVFQLKFGLVEPTSYFYELFYKSGHELLHLPQADLAFLKKPVDEVVDWSQISAKEDAHRGTEGTKAVELLSKSGIILRARYRSAAHRKVQCIPEKLRCKFHKAVLKSRMQLIKTLGTKIRYFWKALTPWRSNFASQTRLWNVVITKNTSDQLKMHWARGNFLCNKTLGWGKTVQSTISHARNETSHHIAMNLSCTKFQRSSKSCIRKWNRSSSISQNRYEFLDFRFFSELNLMLIAFLKKPLGSFLHFTVAQLRTIISEYLNSPTKEASCKLVI